MKHPSVYLKMRVLGALDTVDGRTRHDRVHNVAAMTFLDEQGNPRQFTWRTIQTWHYRYKNHGITAMNQQPRKDKGQEQPTRPQSSGCKSHRASYPIQARSDASALGR